MTAHPKRETVYPPMSVRALPRDFGGSASREDHLVDDVARLEPLVRPDRLAVVRDIVYAEAAVKAEKNVRI